MTFRVLLDACVLAPYELCNTLLTLAEGGLFDPLWSTEILDETRRTMIEKLGVSQEKADRRIGAMIGRFPDSSVGNYESLTASMTNQSKDRHVLAAAVRGGAQVLVTENLRDFPESATRTYDVEVLDPDRFLLTQYDLDPDTTHQSLRDLVALYRAPRMSLIDFLVRLRAATPNFAQLLGSYIRGDSDGLFSRTPAAIVMADPEDVRAAFLPDDDDEIDLENARHVGSAWNIALNQLPDSRSTFDLLCVNPKDWDDPDSLAEHLTNFGFLSGVTYAIEAPDSIAFMRYIEGLDIAGQVFAGGSVRGRALVLTLIRPDATSQWRVFSLGDDYAYAADIFEDWQRP